MIYHNDTESTRRNKIPIGKFCLMTDKEIDNYQRKNKFYFKGQYPKPSQEAIDAAYESANKKINKTVIEKILIAAYKLDY